MNFTSAPTTNDLNSEKKKKKRVIYESPPERHALSYSLGKVDFVLLPAGRHFSNFFGLILDLPGTYASTAQEGNFIHTGHSFPIA